MSLPSVMLAMVALACSAQTSVARAAEPSPAFLALLRAQDVRLAAIGFRLATRNARLCDTLQPAIGVQLHALSQYQPGARRAAIAAFGFATPVSVEGVVAGAPAEAAGIRADDGLVRIANASLPPDSAPLDYPADSAPKVRVELAIAALPADAMMLLTLRRAGVDRVVPVRPVPACRARFELVFDDGAASDGNLVQVGAAYLDRLDDTALAVVVAHELAHNILHHAPRLEAAGVKFGLLSELGKSRRLRQRAEDEADLLSVSLLANAGYDPRSAAMFWRGIGRKFDAGLFRHTAYRSPSARAALIDAELKRMGEGTSDPANPALLKTRAQPLQ